MEAYLLIKTDKKILASLLAVILLMFVPVSKIVAAGHRDSPREVANPATDISDFYLFRSWEKADSIILAMNVFPGQNADDGPVFSNFDNAAIYRLNIDNDMDGRADDLVYEFRFETRSQLIPGFEKFPFPAIGHPNMVNPALRGITALSGPGSEGLRVRQTFTVLEIRKGRRVRLFRDRTLYAVPTDLGPLIMPDYEDLAAQGIYKDQGSGIRVFAGARAEATYADLGVLFSGLNFERFPPFLAEEEDRDDNYNPFGTNRFARANVNSIVIEIPISRITADGKSSEKTQAPFVGGFASVLAPMGFKHSHASDQGRNDNGTELFVHKGWFRQVSRLANPTFNILVTDYMEKDRYNFTAPEYDGNLQESIKYPAFAEYLSQVVGLPVPPSPRLDILQILYKYPGQPLDGDFCGYPCADLLHLNVQVPATAPEMQSRLGALLSPDPAGLPNGRRPSDDVYDITLRAFGGPVFIASRMGDGVNFNSDTPGLGTSDGPGYGEIEGNRLDITENGIVKEFPFLATPHAPGSTQK